MVCFHQDRMIGKSILGALTISRYDRRKMFITFLIVMIALIIDVSISNISDIVSSQITTFWGISLFVVLAGVYVVGQYLIIEMVKTKIRRLMSVPITSRHLILQLRYCNMSLQHVGLNPDEVKFIQIPSDFPLEHRPIIPLNVAYLNYNNNLLR